MNNFECSFLIVGGGISGVSCVETISFLAPDKKCIMLSESPLIKSVSNLVQLGKFLQRFEVKEELAESSSMASKNVNIIQDSLLSIDTQLKIVQTARGLSIKYDLLCLATGASPKLIQHENCEEFILGIRDTESVKEFQKRIENSKKLLLVGNGGIASEIAFELDNISINWIIKDNHISSTFIDAGAAKFFESRMTTSSDAKAVIKRMRYQEEESQSGKGAALGPDWHRLLDIKGKVDQTPKNVQIHHNCEVKHVTRNSSLDDYPITVELTNNELIECDFIVSATGVTPRILFQSNSDFKLGPDGGIWIDEDMKTSVDSIYAAGDVCYAGWEHSKFWFQMRLWTQAKQMGAMAGKSMVAAINNVKIYQDFCFELFGHVTSLFGYQVVLLGKYNGQGLDNKYEILLRYTSNLEYVKFILFEGKLHGALLIGETGLEEVCENLILNQIDLTPFGEDILNPDIDIEDYFD